MIKDAKACWESVYNEFVRQYPDLAKDMIDWYPSSQTEITVKIRKRGWDQYKYEKYAFDILAGAAYKVHGAGTEELSEDEWRKRLSIKLRSKIQNVGLTQEELSDITGLSQPTISRYMTGRATPNTYHISKIARALRCSIAELTAMNYE